MKKLVGLAGLTLLLLGGAASAESITGNYTVSIVPTNSDPTNATVTNNLPQLTGPTPLHFSIGVETTGPLTDTLFITANPIGSTAFKNLTETSKITVSFTNLKVNGMSVGNVTAFGDYSAMYDSTGFNGTDSIDWEGATAMAGIPSLQDDTTPLVLKIAMGDADLDLVDGADWNVQTAILATPLAATPLPGAVWLFGSVLGFAGVMSRRKRNKSSVSMLAT